MPKGTNKDDPSIVNFMAQHFVPLMVRMDHYHKDGSFREENTTVLSGFVMEIDDQWYWTTAGHSLKQLDEQIAAGKLSVLGCSFVDYMGYQATKKLDYPFMYEPGCGIAVHEPTEGLDYALIPIDPLMRINFADNKVKPIEKRTWVHTPHLKFDFYKLLGIPESQVTLSPTDDEAISFTPVLASVIPIDTKDVPRISSHQWFAGKMPAVSQIKTVVGMSGGPIFGFRKHPDGQLAYHVVALQSRWFEKTDFVMGCSLPYFMKVFRQRTQGGNRQNIHVESRRKKLETIQKKYPNATIVDVTSKSSTAALKFSPFYPHGDIPIPGTDQTGQSVEGIWQGLKVFEKEGVDSRKWMITNMMGIKRSGASRGKVLGHQFGNELLGYLDARRQIYLHIYRWVLENKMATEIEQLRQIDGDIVLLDYETNGDFENLSKPMSHASLIARFLSGELSD